MYLSARIANPEVVAQHTDLFEASLYFPNIKGEKEVDSPGCCVKEDLEQRAKHSAYSAVYSARGMHTTVMAIPKYCPVMKRDKKRT